MKEIQGDILKLVRAGEFDVIVHGCNCFNNFGAGIARSIRDEFPFSFYSDSMTIRGDRDKLGTYTKADYICEDVFNKRICFTIINGYTQYSYGGGERNVDYDAIRKVFKLIKQDYSGKRIGYPAIGAGLGGGDWSIISAIIEEELEGEDHTFVKYIN